MALLISNLLLLTSWGVRFWWRDSVESVYVYKGLIVIGLQLAFLAAYFYRKAAAFGVVLARKPEQHGGEEAR